MFCKKTVYQFKTMHGKLGNTFQLATNIFVTRVQFHNQGFTLSVNPYTC